MESEEGAKNPTSRRAHRRCPRFWARALIVLADISSSVLCALPLLLGYSVVADLWARATGTYSDFIEEGFLLESVGLALVLVAVALLPAVLVNSLLGARAEWSVRVRLLVAGVLIPIGFVMLLIWPELGGLLAGIVLR